MTALNVFKMPGAQTVKPSLKLPGPRIWDPKLLADFLGISVSWIYKRTQSTAEDPIPHIPGIGRLKFDTENPRFQAWLCRTLGLVDIGDGDE